MPDVPAKQIPEDLRDRLRKLILMLSSEHTGERANASALIDKMLKDNGLDWHDFANHLLTPTPPAPARQRPPWEDTADTEMAWSDVPPDEPVNLASPVVMSLIDEILDNSRYLSPKSRMFLLDLHRRAESYRAVRFSPKQLRWFGNLAIDAGVQPPWGLR